MVVHAFLCHGRPNYFGRSLNPWTKLIHFLWYFLLDSLSHELTWTWFGHGQLHGRMECDSNIKTVKYEKKKKRKPPNVTKELSHVMLKLHNVRMKPLNVRKK